MSTVGNVYVQILPGHVRVVVEGDDPSHPWELMLNPQAAFNLGNELRIKAEDLGVRLKTPVQSRSNAPPVRRPPANNGSNRGPQTSADGNALLPESFNPQAPQGETPGGDLLGDTF